VLSPAKTKTKEWFMRTYKCQIYSAIFMDCQNDLKVSQFVNLTRLSNFVTIYKNINQF